MKFNDILNDLKAKKYKSLYFFDGDEPYFIDALTNYMSHHILDEAERDFNQSILYGQDLAPSDLAPIVKRYPMMAERQVVIVKEAQNWRSLLDLEPIFANPVPTTILVINYKGKKLDGRSKLIKLIKENGVYFNSAKVKPYEVGKWISQYCQSKQVKIDTRATAMLSENIGNDLGNLVNALDKLQILCPEGESISPDLVSKNIGISKDFNEFELQNALGQKDDKKALYIANYFANNQKEHHIIKVSINLYYYFAKLIKYHSLPNKADNQSVARAMGVNPYFVKDFHVAARNYPKMSLLRVMEILYDIDLKSKGVNNTGSKHGDLMKEMVSRLLRV